MGRHKQPEIRDRILDACVDHALAHGLPDRLEPFVKASGCSTRMLIYHFGTRDALLRETLRRARQRQREFYGDLLSPKPGEPYLSTLRSTWRAMTGLEGRPYPQSRRMVSWNDFGPKRRPLRQTLGQDKLLCLLLTGCLWNLEP